MIDNTKFANKADLFSYLVENKKEIICLKKSTVKECDFWQASALGEANKAAGNNDANVIKRTIIANTYNWMDSHNDVHIEGIFTKSISENKKSVLHLHDHVHQLTAKVGTPTDIYEKKISWAELGQNIPGKTTALFMDSDIKKEYNSQIFTMYKNGEITQHSVGMLYVELFLCLNDAEYKEEYAAWLKYFPVIGNAIKAFEQGYFFAVTEAKLKEVSCVIAGSNELTPTLEPSEKDTQNKEPQGSTLKNELLTFKIW